MQHCIKQRKMLKTVPLGGRLKIKQIQQNKIQSHSYLKALSTYEQKMDGRSDKMKAVPKVFLC